jgi:hypothetical protein
MRLGGALLDACRAGHAEIALAILEELQTLRTQLSDGVAAQSLGEKGQLTVLVKAEADLGSELDAKAILSAVIEAKSADEGGTPVFYAAKTGLAKVCDSAMCPSLLSLCFHDGALYLVV